MQFGTYHLPCLCLLPLTAPDAAPYPRTSTPGEGGDWSRNGAKFMVGVVDFNTLTASLSRLLSYTPTLHSHNTLTLHTLGTCYLMPVCCVFWAIRMPILLRIQ